MSSFSNVPGGNFSTPKRGTGRHAFLFMGGIFATFVGFYAFLDAKDRNRVAKGNLYSHEYDINRPREHMRGFSSSTGTPKLPTHEHDAHHVSRASPEAGSLYMQPSPQKTKRDGTVHTRKTDPWREDFKANMKKHDE